MKTKMMYIAEDGREFDDMKKCEDYEKEIIRIEKIAKDLQNYCISQSCTCCTFLKSCECILKGIPIYWKLDESGD